MLKRNLSLTLVLYCSVSVCWAAADPFVGKWKLNSSQTTLTDQMTIQATGDNKYGFTFNGAGEAETVTADGTDQPGFSGTMLSVTVEEPHTWKIVRKKEGRILLKATWKLSKDGKTLSDAFTAYRPDGSTSTTDMVYKRIAGNAGIPGTWETTDVKVDGVHELEIRPYDSDGLSFISSDAASPRNIIFDGKEHLDPATGASLAGHRINERSLEFTNKIKGKISEARQLTVSPDFKTLTILVHPTNQRLPNTLVFDRK